MRRMFTGALLVVAVVATGCPGGSDTAERTPSITSSVADSRIFAPPASVPSGSVQDRAAGLAADVVAGGETGEGALLTATRLAGIGIRDVALDDRIVQEPDAPHQGIAFQAGEIHAIAGLEARGTIMDLSDISATIAGVDRSLQLDAGKVERSMLTDLKDTAKQGPTTYKFWALFIAELGRQRDPAFDVLRAKAGSPVPLDFVQVAFITLRFLGDLAAKLPAEAREIVPGTVDTDASTGSVVGMVAQAGPFGLGSVLADAPHPCSVSGDPWMDGLGEVFQGGFDLTAGYAWDHINEEHEGGGPSGADKAATTLAIIKTILALVEYGAAVYLLKAEVSMDGAEPFVRTKTTSNGEVRELKTTVSFTSGNSQWLNCMKILLNAAGLSFSIPGGGPFGNASITWELTEGGAKGTGSSIGTGLVQFKGNPVTKTNDDGESTIELEGVKQKTDLPSDASPVTKRAIVTVQVALQDMNFYQGIRDALSAAKEGTLSGLQVALGILKRWKIPAGSRTIQVRDWTADYRIHHVVSGLTFDAEKCGGPIGLWDIDIHGDFNEGFELDGYIHTYLNQSHTQGSYTGQMSGTISGGVTLGSNIVGGKLDVSGDFVGSASFRVSDKTLEIKTRKVSGNLSASAFAPGESGKYDKGFNQSGGGISLPVEVGSFCS